MTASGIQLLLPALRRWPKTLPDRLVRALGRADRLFLDTPQADVAFWSAPASAALARLGEGDLDLEDVRAHRWLRADPAWLHADINGARLLAIDALLPVWPEDAEAFAPQLQTLFDDVGAVLDVVDPRRWYLRLPADASLPRFFTPAEALGGDLFDHRPEGDDASAWRALDGEAQVLLHNHPHNARRVAAGLPPINGIWLWGDKPLPDSASASFPTFGSADPLLRGMARLANINVMDLPGEFPRTPTGAYDLRPLRGDALLDGWLLPAVDALATTGPTLWHSEDGTGFALAAHQHWRLWRRPFRLETEASPVE